MRMVDLIIKKRNNLELSQKEIEFIIEDGSTYYSVISKDFQIGNKYTSITYAFDNFFIFNKLNRFFSWLGNYTFEVFLTHLFLFDLYEKLVTKNIIAADNLMIYIFIVFLIIPFSILLSLVSKCIKKLLKI